MRTRYFLLIFMMLADTAFAADALPRSASRPQVARPTVARPNMPGRGGLAYTTEGAKNTSHMQHLNIVAPEDEENTDGTQAMKTITNPDPKAEDTATPDDSKTEDKHAAPEEAAKKAWEKYKALAAGTYKDEEPKKEKVAEKKKDDTEAEPKAAPNTGLAALLEEYRENKKRRSQMRTITFHEPDKDKTAEP